MSKQLVITPDCPRCGGALWAIPCPAPGGACADDHYECVRCAVEWVYREGDRRWYRFDADGRVLEMIPPRPRLFAAKPLSSDSPGAGRSRSR